jgi:oxygen-independent coproporphyrinogen III oxidase
MSATTSALPAAPLHLEEPTVGNYFVAAYPPFSSWASAHDLALVEALEQTAPATPVGVYAHIPFCQKKCDYCYYLSYIGQQSEVVDAYIDALVAELFRYASFPAMQGRAPAFLYFGGGTPSTLTSAQARRLGFGLKSALAASESAPEFTCECAPRSVRPDFLRTLREIGVNRLSMGVQCFDDALLKWNGRIHLVEDVLRAHALIQQFAFEWVNIDLMVGLLGETWPSWGETIQQAIALGADSVTIYQTEIPFNTQLYREVQQKSLPAPLVSWPEKRERLAFAFSELENAGYTIVSAYTAARDPSRHRFQYQEHLWRGGDMLGLGVASFGYFGGVHYQNEVTLEKYRQAIAAEELPLKRAFRLKASDQLVREFILQLKWGRVDLRPFEDKFGVNPTEHFAPILKQLKAEGFLDFTETEVTLTRAGLTRADQLLPLFYDPRFQNLRYT